MDERTEAEIDNVFFDLLAHIDGLGPILVRLFTMDLSRAEKIEVNLRMMETLKDFLSMLQPPPTNNPYEEMDQATLDLLANTMAPFTAIAAVMELQAEPQPATAEGVRSALSGLVKLQQLSHVKVAETRAKRRLGPARRIEIDKDGKNAALAAIQAEWKKRKDAGTRINASDFALEMAKLHHFAVTVGAVKNSQTRWNKEYHPAS